MSARRHSATRGRYGGSTPGLSAGQGPPAEVKKIWTLVFAFGLPWRAVGLPAVVAVPPVAVRSLAGLQSRLAGCYGGGIGRLDERIGDG